jgi:hypothetical protein
MKNYNAILCDTDEIIAEDNYETRHQKMTRKVKDKSASGDVTGCTKIAADSKTTYHVKSNQDITERLEHYRIRYPDAKIVK